jgi:uncharacterized protein (DUF2461 family)
MRKIGLMYILVRSDGWFWTGTGWAADVELAKRMPKAVAERAAFGYRKVVLWEEPDALKHAIARLKPLLRQMAEENPAVLTLYGLTD